MRTARENVAPVTGVSDACRRSAQIISGISPGDTVVLYPGENLSDGVRVQRRGQE
jgi:hypothetical protein